MTPSIRRLNWPVLALAALLALFWGALTAGLLRAETRLASGLSAVTVTPLPSAPGDSALVIASWGRGCDWRGCPAQYEVVWSGQAGGQQASLPPRTVTVTRDSVSVPWPAWGDSLLVGVAVRSLRRGQWSGVSLGSVLVTRPDSAPPAPDSLRLTIPDSVIEAAMRDSYPDESHRFYSTNGWQYRVDSLLAEGPDSLPVEREGVALTIEAGYATGFCHWATNKYTRLPLLFVPHDLVGTERERHAEECTARIRQLVPDAPPPLPRAPTTQRGA